MAATGGNVYHVALFDPHYKATAAALTRDMDISDAAFARNIVFILVATFTALDMELSAVVARSEAGTAFRIVPPDIPRASHPSFAAVPQVLAPVCLHR